MKKLGLTILFSCAFLQTYAAEQRQAVPAEVNIDDIYMIICERQKIGKSEQALLHAFLNNGDEVYVAYSRAEGVRYKLAQCREGQQSEKRCVSQSLYNDITKLYNRWRKNDRREIEGGVDCRCAFHRKADAEPDDENKWDGEL